MFKKGDRVHIADNNTYNNDFRDKDATITEDEGPDATYVSVRVDGFDHRGMIDVKHVTLINAEPSNFTLTLDQLRTIENELRKAGVNSDSAREAIAIVDDLLHPTRTQTFTVTVTVPKSDPIMTAKMLEVAIKSEEVGLAYPVVVTNPATNPATKNTNKE